jgi:hypothetical protein
MATNLQIEELASEIGDKIYIDVAKWHLYLKDAKLHTLVAAKALDILSEGSMTGDKLTELLSSISIDLGGGRKKVTLLDLIPVTGQANLMDIITEFARDL